MTDSQAEQSKKLLNVIEDNVYSQPLDFPTHVSGSLNNIVLCTVQNMILDIEDLGGIGPSDHNTILCQIQSCITMKRKEKTRGNWNKANFD